MKLGDIVINPYVPKLYNGKPNPCYAFIYIKRKNGSLIVGLDFKGRIGEWYVKKEEEAEWKIIDHIDIFDEISKNIDWSEEE